MFIGILYKRYFDRLRLGRSSDIEENPEPRASRRSCRIVYTNIRGLHKYLLDLSLMARSGNEFFFVLRLLSLPGVAFPSLWFWVLADR